jgi:hypothetical protein
MAAKADRAASNSVRVVNLMVFSKSNRGKAAGGLPVAVRQREALYQHQMAHAAINGIKIKNRLNSDVAA